MKESLDAAQVALNDLSALNLMKVNHPKLLHKRSAKPNSDAVNISHLL